MKPLFLKLKTFLKSKPVGVDYTWGKMVFWMIIAVVFFGVISLLGSLE